METTKITDSQQPLFWYISPLFITNTEGANKVLTDFQQQVNKGIKSYQDNKSDLEHCQNLKQYLSHQLAELKLMGYVGPYVEEMIEKIENIIAILDTGIALGEKEQAYHSGGLPYYRAYPWFKEGETYDPETLEGYLKLHYREFSAPTYGVVQFVNSGYFKHCQMKDWGTASTITDTFCQLYNKRRVA